MAKVKMSKGFVRAEAEVRKRLICAIDGLEKQGKTHFALTAPGPIAVISTDIGLDGVIQKFQKKKEIWVAEHKIDVPGLIRDTDIQVVSKAAQTAWKELGNRYQEALETPEIRTIIWDTATEFWEILRMARFGKLTQVMPHHYGPVNAEFRELLRRAHDLDDKHLILLHKMKDQYVNDKRTGEVKRAGMADTGFLVQVAGRAWKDDKEPAVPDKFHFTIAECRFDPELEGVDLSGADCTFPSLCAAVLGGEAGEYE